MLCILGVIEEGIGLGFTVLGCLQLIRVRI